MGERSPGGGGDGGGRCDIVRRSGDGRDGWAGVAYGDVGDDDSSDLKWAGYGDLLGAQACVMRAGATTGGAGQQAGSSNAGGRAGRGPGGVRAQQ